MKWRSNREPPCGVLRRVEFVCALAALTVVGTPAGAQSPPRNRNPTATFSPAQASEGKAAYAKNCASCHGVNLSGGEFAIGLRGRLTLASAWASAGNSVFASCPPFTWMR